MDAYLSGLEQADAAGKDLSTIHSVASFFVASTPRSTSDSRRWAVTTCSTRPRSPTPWSRTAPSKRCSAPTDLALAAKGANQQRPLWASTGTKDPNLPDTLYVTNLVADGVVNTMPEKTMDAFADHGEVGPSIVGKAEADGQAILDEVTAAGVDLAEVFRVLEDEGVDKFIVSWNELVTSVEKAIH